MRIDGKVFDMSPAGSEPSSVHLAETSSRKSDFIVRSLVRMENSLNIGRNTSSSRRSSFNIDTHDLSRGGMRCQRICSILECRTMEASSPSTSTATLASRIASMSGARQAHTASMANSFCSTCNFIRSASRLPSGISTLSTGSAMVTDMIPKKCASKSRKVVESPGISPSLTRRSLSHTAFRAGVYSSSTKCFQAFLSDGLGGLNFPLSVKSDFPCGTLSLRPEWWECAA
mmetsp:Transcript_10245/g.42345  ORF Transcript_10245/g.42345 Transcript_10245/m.42345 type:complete len:230 (+) Transcript_10245:4508-5197(+)